MKRSMVQPMVNIRMAIMDICEATGLTESDAINALIDALNKDYGRDANVRPIYFYKSILTFTCDDGERKLPHTMLINVLAGIRDKKIDWEFLIDTVFDETNKLHEASVPFDQFYIHLRKLFILFGEIANIDLKKLGLIDKWKYGVVYDESRVNLTVNIRMAVIDICEVTKLTETEVLSDLIHILNDLADVKTMYFEYKKYKLLHRYSLPFLFGIKEQEIEWNYPVDEVINEDENKYVEVQIPFERFNIHLSDLDLLLKDQVDHNDYSLLCEKWKYGVSNVHIQTELPIKDQSTKQIKREAVLRSYIDKQGINTDEPIPIGRIRLWDELGKLESSLFPPLSIYTIKDFFDDQNICKLKVGRPKGG